jgi:septal ring factor EnvC (AmiA/AmiB activator)
MNSIVNKNMDEYFSKILRTIPENKQPESSIMKYIKNNIMVVSMICIVVILFIINICMKEDKEIIKKKKIKQKQFERKQREKEKEQDELLNNIDKQTLLNIIDELSELASKNYKLQQELNNKNIGDANAQTGFKSLNAQNITNVNGYVVESPFV